jgi:hypothetical protein
VETKKFISFGISKYVDFWKVGIVQSSTYEMKMKSYVELGRCFVAFVKIITTSKSTLLEGLWPSSNWRSNYVKASLSTVMDVVDPKDPI